MGDRNIEITVLPQIKQEVIITNSLDEQMIDIDQDCSQNIDIDILPLQEIDVEQDGININVNPAPSYEGEYEVIPKITEQTLPTAQRLLEEDVHIKEIPYFEVSNNSGGNTVYIGNEV